MGFYDFFKGECPNCNCQLDSYNGRVFGDIQTKMFCSESNRTNYFREFRPGDHVPFSPYKSTNLTKTKTIPIGTTTCCDTAISAIFDGDLLIKYVVSK